MTDLILHKNKQYIDEDLAYYFSGQRDVNNQIRPQESIYSLSPDSQHFNTDFNDGQVGSLFFPIAAYSIDRIYIGISFPLFANNWGAAFLRYLMTRVKPDGCVILPVYPEMQASEKNYWSRSILENTFLSRSRWKGTSNIWAENDGVMSMRIGRKFPAEMNSTASFFFEESGNSILRRSLQAPSHNTSNQQQLFELGQHYWNTANTYSIVERIILDYFGMQQAVTLCDISDSNGLMAIECLFSREINVTQAVSFMTDKTHINDTSLLSKRYHSVIKNRFKSIDTSITDTLNDLANYKVICLINTTTNGATSDKTNEVIANALDKLMPGGILIVHESQGLSVDVLQLLDNYPMTSYYSSIVASKLQNGDAISHYSSIIETELVSENNNRKYAYIVIQKHH